MTASETKSLSDISQSKSVRVLDGCVVRSRDDERLYQAGDKLSLAPSEADELVEHGFVEPTHE